MKVISGFVFALLLLFVINCGGGGGGGGAAEGQGGPDSSPTDTAEQALDVPAEDTSTITAQPPAEDIAGADSEEDLSNDTVQTLPSDGGGVIVTQETKVAEPETKTEETPAVVETKTEEGTAEEAKTEEGKTEEKDTQVASEKTEPSIEDAESEQEALELLEDEEIEAILTEIEEDASANANKGKGGFSYVLDSTAGKWYQTPQGSTGKVSKGEYNKQTSRIRELRDRIQDLAKSMKDSNKVEVRAQIRDLLDQIQSIRNTIGYGTDQKGIHTYWANENLYLRVSNVPVAGWYRLRIVAKNYGSLPLPDWYDFFNIEILNERIDKKVGGLFIKASADQYNRGTALVYLDKGDTNLNLLWSNEACKEKEYDANIQISSVTLEKYNGERRMSKLVRRAHQFSELDGRFFFDHNSVRTYWANQTIGFNFPNLEPGKYRVIIDAKNYGTLPLPSGYSEFEVNIEADGTSGIAKIPASSNNWEHGFAVLDLTGGNTDVFLTWMNDKYRENEYDTNIQIHKIRLQRIGDSERSALAAYLLGATGRNKGVVAGGFVFIMMAIAALVLWNRRRTRLQI